jgi:hypothetical protein
VDWANRQAITRVVAHHGALNNHLARSGLLAQRDIHTDHRVISVHPALHIIWIQPAHAHLQPERRDRVLCPKLCCVHAPFEFRKRRSFKPWINGRDLAPPVRRNGYEPQL